jgi:hypothetical protein
VLKFEADKLLSHLHLLVTYFGPYPYACDLCVLIEILIVHADVYTRHIIYDDVKEQPTPPKQNSCTLIFFRL